MSRKKLFTNISDTPSINANDTHILDRIKKKYLLVIVLLIGIGIFLGFTFQGIALTISYIFLSLLIGASYMMWMNLYYFQKIGIQYHPLMMTQYFELVAVAGFIALLIHTVPYVQITHEWIIYIPLWVVCFIVWYQFRSMFWIVMRAANKKKI